MESAQSDPAASGGAPIRFQLFVAGETARSRLAIENLDRILKARPETLCEVEVIDVLTSPERAEQERVLATPTLIRELPLPRRRVTGDLSDSDTVLKAIGPLDDEAPPTRGSLS